MIHTYRYTAQLLGNFVRDLSSSRSAQKQRLTKAITTHFNKLNEDHFPPDLLNQYKKIQEKLRIPESIESQSLDSLINSMDDSDIAELIGDILELSQRIDFTVKS